MSTGLLTGVSAEALYKPLRTDVGLRAEPRAAAAVAPRNEAIDVVRLFAAAGIVFVHAAQSPAFDNWGNLLRFGVPFFLFASLYFQSLSLRRKTDRTLWEYVAGRLNRLYLPFVVWSAIYLVTRDVKRIWILHIGAVELHPSVLWTGTEYHLWFLPFLLAWSIVLAVVHYGLLRHDRRWRWLVIAGAVAAGCAVARLGMPIMPSVNDVTPDDPTYTYIAWWLALPAACWAMAFAWFMTAGPAVFAVPPILGWGGIALVLGCSVKQALHGIQLTARGLSGLGAMFAALAPWSGTAMSKMARVGRLGYGIYLCHVLPVEILRVAAVHCHLQPSVGLDLVIFALSFAAAAGIVTALGKSPRLAWLNG